MPATYSNLPQSTSVSNYDPFDTSHIYSSSDSRYYSDVTARSSSYSQNKSQDLRNESSDFLSTPNLFEDNSNNIYQNNVLLSPTKNLDRKFVTELEKNVNVLGTNVNTSIPTIQPPPQHNKSPLKKHPNFLSDQESTLNSKVNTWLTKTTNIHVDQQRPFSMYLSTAFHSTNECNPILSPTRSVENLTLPEFESQYSNNVTNLEAMLNQIQISDKETVLANNESNLFKDNSNKCDKIPLHTEFMTMITKSSGTMDRLNKTNLYDNTQNIYNSNINTENSLNENSYTNTSAMFKTISDSATASAPSNSAFNDECSSNMYKTSYSNMNGTQNNEVNKSDKTANANSYVANFPNAQCKYDDNIYGCSSAYNNISNIYDAVADENIYQDTRSIKNIYDSVAGDYNYYDTVEDEINQSTCQIKTPLNTVS